MTGNVAKSFQPILQVTSFSSNKHSAFVAVQLTEERQVLACAVCVAALAGFVAANVVEAAAAVVLDESFAPPCRERLDDDALVAWLRVVVVGVLVLVQDHGHLYGDLDEEPILPSWASLELASPNLCYKMPIEPPNLGRCHPWCEEGHRDDETLLYQAVRGQ